MPILAAFDPTPHFLFLSVGIHITFFHLHCLAKMSATTTITSPPEITADNVATLFPEVDTSLAREVLPTSQTNTARGSELEGYDEEQVRLMDEVCIVLDNNDRPIGSASKKLCTFHDPIITRRDTEWRGSGNNMRDRTLTDAFA